MISLPPGTEMFQFPGFASLRRVMTRLAPRRVSPFGHPGLTGCVLLPPAYRSLPRPSSPLCAQASPTYLRSLDYKRVSSRARAIYTSECINSERHEAAHRLLQSPDDDSSSAIIFPFPLSNSVAYAPRDVSPRDACMPTETKIEIAQWRGGDFRVLSRPGGAGRYS